MNTLKWYMNGMESEATEGQDGVIGIKLCDQFESRAYIHYEDDMYETVVCNNMLLTTKLIMLSDEQVEQIGFGH